MPLDERLYGIAPLERDAHGGHVYLTMAGLLKKLDISESTLRRDVELMQIRKTIAEGTFRWVESEVDAVMTKRTATPRRSAAERRRVAVRAICNPNDRKKRTGRERDSAIQAKMAAKMAEYYQRGKGA